MYNYKTDSLELILGVEVFFLLVTVQEHCDLQSQNLDVDFIIYILIDNTDTPFLFSSCLAIVKNCKELLHHCKKLVLALQ